MKRFLTLMVSMLSMTNLLAQGLIIDDTLYHQLPTEIIGLKSVQLKSKADLSAFVPTIFNQGSNKPICVPLAIAYNAYTIQVARKFGITNKRDIQKIALSASYIYQKLQPKCEFGLSLEAVTDFLSANGDPFDHEYAPEPCQNTGSPSLDNGLVATNKFFLPYKTNYPKEKEILPSNIRLAAQYALDSLHKPVIIGIASTTINLDRKTNFFYPTSEPTTSVGHAVVAVGYDNDKQAFYSVNTYGEAFGNKGFFWLSYKDFDKYVKTSTTLNITEQNPLETRVGADFELLTKGKQIPVQLISSGYYLAKLSATDSLDIVCNHYWPLVKEIYVFGITKSGNLIVLFPHTLGFAEFNKNFNSISEKLPSQNMSLLLNGKSLSADSLSYIGFVAVSGFDFNDEMRGFLKALTTEKSGTVEEKFNNFFSTCAKYKKYIYQPKQISVTALPENYVLPFLIKTTTD